MAKQESYDTVVAHARKQGRKSLTDDGMGCLYRGPHGAKCFVGAVLPDADCTMDLEGCPADGYRVSEILRRLGHDVALMEDLQSIHDSSEVDTWESGFERLADKYSLIYTPPKGG